MLGSFLQPVRCSTLAAKDLHHVQYLMYDAKNLLCGNRALTLKYFIIFCEESFFNRSKVLIKRANFSSFTGSVGAWPSLLCLSSLRTAGMKSVGRIPAAFYNTEPNDINWCYVPVLLAPNHVHPEHSLQVGGAEHFPSNLHRSGTASSLTATLII